MKSIYLIGFMGAGKTTIGRELGQAIHYPVIDTDEKIVLTEGREINNIFSTFGEAYFRKLETKILKSLPVCEHIITTGGGIVLNEENRKWMRKHGTVLFLYCEPEEILQRLENDITRPLLKNNKKEAVYNLYKQRLPIYKQTAHYTVDTTQKSISEIVSEIETRLKTASGGHTYKKTKK
ncbi:shikimate kinase [Bacillus aquiflavi]|uniref:Shikimate kinase n=1 Tax=Bacillus aquiflavi TaxID=2672567 RepID=A0A6B3VXB6_9BACI|nr:shikimate kinase [Bacillus aquiflavi]MBA4535800.1 shikimate kinase [Bacillus aquiflavi]NEY80176.1 shikimate kinase [Bacillus aquiflavi]UAC47227.1 shikimate kinase [Bacillus aquiflavi]